MNSKSWRKKCDVFISYRRSNGWNTAYLLYRSLSDRGYSVFIDTEDMHSGDFNVQLYDKIMECKDYVIVLTEDSLTRCYDKNDWVRKEIVCALQYGKNIVPFMHTDFTFPDVEGNPDEELVAMIKALESKQGVTQRQELFDACLDRMCSYFVSKPGIAWKKWLQVGVAAVMCLALIAIAVTMIAGSGAGTQKASTSETDRDVASAMVSEADADPVSDAGKSGGDNSGSGKGIESSTADKGSGSQPSGKWEDNQLMPMILTSRDYLSGEQWVEYARRSDVFGSGMYTREQISTITFLDTLDDQGSGSWRVPSTKNGDIRAWVKADGGLYHLYISADGGVLLPADSRDLFSGYVNLRDLDFGNALHFDVTTNTGRMFLGCSKLEKLDLSGFDSSYVHDFSLMFYGCEALEELVLDDGFVTGAANNLQEMFEGCAALESVNLKGWNTANVRDTSQMFEGCSSLKALVFPSDIDTSKVMNMDFMFEGCSELEELDISGFDTGSVKSMMYMFSNCNSLQTLDVGSFDTAAVTDMEYMFNECSSVEALDVSHFNTAKVTNMFCMFTNCRNLTELNLGSFDVSKVEYMEYMFNDCVNLTILTLPVDFDCSRVRSMTFMFDDCSCLESLNLGGLKTKNISDISSMFYGCESLKDLVLPAGFDTSKVEDMNSMFGNCYALEAIDLSFMDTSKVTNMSDMFYGCRSLKHLDLSGFDTSSLTDDTDMFKNCAAYPDNVKGWNR